MDTIRRRIFFREGDFNRAWCHGSSQVGTLGRGKRPDRPHREVVGEASHFIAGALLSEGFALFNNGGLPQIERRSGRTIQEILIRSHPNSIDDPDVPIRISLHLSHSGLQETRMNYWIPSSRAPSSVASMDLGHLEIPPCWVIWNIGSQHQTLVELVQWIQNLALPWFDLFENEMELRRRLLRCDVPRIGLDTALELIISEFGEYEGARFLRDVILTDPLIASNVRQLTLDIARAKAVGGMGRDLITNLATIAACYRMIRR